ncbi:MAG: flagellar biosynthetic protein FliR [Actinomycetes bacterium]
MTLDVPAGVLVAFLLAGIRAAGWLVLAPPFSSPAIPPVLRALFAAALALPVTPRLANAGLGRLNLPGLLSEAVLQVTIGVVLGFFTALFFAVLRSAGELIDVLGGFSLSVGMDPMSASETSVFGRFHQMLGLMLLFAVNGHLLLVRGFLASFDALPLGSGFSLATVGRLATGGLSQLFLAAVQVAAPVAGVLFIANLSLGLLTRAAPSLNAFSLAFPLQILVTLAVVAVTFPAMPTLVRNLTDLSLRAGSVLLHG